MAIRVVGMVCLLGLVILVPPLRSDETTKSTLPLTGKPNEKFARIDDLVRSFIEKNKLPGAALTIGYQGEIVHSRGFGYADMENRQPVQPDALFRLSSVSKVFTGAAIMKLVEKGKLDLDAPVVKVLGLKPTGKDQDERWEKITIRNLVENRSGFDHRYNADPMYYSPHIVRKYGGTHPAPPSLIIRYMLTQKLHYDPGEKFGYSNFGYCLLGRVIEKVSGQRYETYVKENILKPLGITRARQGRTLPGFRVQGEVKYYSSKKSPAIMGPFLGRQVPNPYGAWCMESMDASSGWICSAPDLVRFAMAFADPKSCKILSKESVETMFAKPAKTKDNAYYAKGWLVAQFPAGKRVYWHDGSMDGSSTLVVHRPDGVTFAILFNSREKTEKTEPIGAVETPINQALTAIFAKK